MFLGACATAAQTAEPALRELLEKGTITQEQYDTLLAALSGSTDWVDILSKIGGVAATVLIGALGLAKTPALVKNLKKNGSAATA